MEIKELFLKLKVNPKNPRTISKEAFDKLKESIKKFPQMLEKRQVVYDENFIILGGNMRLLALQDLVKEGFILKEGYFTEVKGWTEEQKREFIIRDNISDGAWDYELLANEWDDKKLSEWGINIGDWSKEGENKEINSEELTEGLNAECPRCGFKFKYECSENKEDE